MPFTAISVPVGTPLSLEQATKLNLEAKVEWAKSQPKDLAPYPPIYFNRVDGKLHFSFEKQDGWREIAVNTDDEFIWLKSVIESKESQ